MSDEREFYVGYQETAPTGVSRFLRFVVASLSLLGVTLAALLAGAVQEPFDPGLFEFGVVRSYEGVVRERPHPMLIVEDSGSGGRGAATSDLLVAVGKHGADEQVAGLDGRRVTVEGTLIHREGQTMIEIVAGSVAVIDTREAPSRSVARAVTRQTLRGEIVDSKCFLGVMKPGRGKPHRACAARCISGGVPPVLRVETATGDFRHYLLADSRGEPVNDRILDLVAEPVEVTGKAFRRDNLWYLEADPETFQRLGLLGEE